MGGGVGRVAHARRVQVVLSRCGAAQHGALGSAVRHGTTHRHGAVLALVARCLTRALRPAAPQIGIPPSVTTIAEAAVGRDTIMRAVASAVLQVRAPRGRARTLDPPLTPCGTSSMAGTRCRPACRAPALLALVRARSLLSQADAVEAALLAALPLGPQTPAGGVSLPEAFKGELGVALREGRGLPVWGFPGQSNPYCRLVLGEQVGGALRRAGAPARGRPRAAPFARLSCGLLG